MILLLKTILRFNRIHLSTKTTNLHLNSDQTLGRGKGYDEYAYGVDAIKYVKSSHLIALSLTYNGIITANNGFANKIGIIELPKYEKR